MTLSPERRHDMFKIEKPTSGLDLDPDGEVRYLVQA
jgi:hypothetical protein